MDVGYDFIGFVKTNTDFKKGNTKNLTKDWPVVSYLALKRNPVVPGDRQTIAIGYRYNSNKVIPLIDTEGAGIKEADMN